MGMEEIQVLRGIEGRLGRLEAYYEAQARATSELTANVSRLVEKLDKSDDIAREADQRAKSAQHQINDIKNHDLAEVKADIKWLWRTVIGAVIVAVTSGAGALVWKTLGG